MGLALFALDREQLTTEDNNYNQLKAELHQVKEELAQLKIQIASTKEFTWFAALSVHSPSQIYVDDNKEAIPFVGGLSWKFFFNTINPTYGTSSWRMCARPIPKTSITAKLGFTLVNNLNASKSIYREVQHQFLAYEKDEDIPGPEFEKTISWSVLVNDSIGYRLGSPIKFLFKVIEWNYI